MSGKVVDSAAISKLVADADAQRMADAKEKLDAADGAVRVQDNCVVSIDADANTFTITGSLDPDKVGVVWESPRAVGKKGTLFFVRGGGWDFRGPHGERFTLTGYRKV